MFKKTKTNLLPNSEEYYEVQEIIDKKLTSNGMMYLIRWAGYPEQKDYTWEPVQHLTQVERLVKEFNTRWEKSPTAPTAPIAPKEQKQQTIKLSSRLAQKLKKHDESSEVEVMEEQSQPPSKKRPRVKINSKKVKKSLDKSQSQNEDDSEEIQESKPRRIDSRKSKESNKQEKYTKPTQKQEIDRFWEKQGLQLGRIHKHYNSDGQLVFNVNLTKEEGLYGSIYLSFDTLKRLCEDKLINYMQNQVKYKLVQEKELKTTYARQFQNFWKGVIRNQQ